MLNIKIGKDLETNKEIQIDLSKIPHILVSGITGSGKSTLINSLIVDLITNYDSTQLKLIIIDPKRTDFNIFANIPNLWMPIVKDKDKALLTLQRIYALMEARQKLLERYSSKNIDDYNANRKMKLPYILVIIDEYANLIFDKDKKHIIMLTAQLLAMARASGIYLIIGTQKPVKEVFQNPTIKSNINIKIAKQVDNRYDSMVVLDSIGAEDLISNKEMLVKCNPIFFNKLKKLETIYYNDSQIESIIKTLKGIQSFNPYLIKEREKENEL